VRCLNNSRRAGTLINGARHVYCSSERRFAAAPQPPRCRVERPSVCTAAITTDGDPTDDDHQDNQFDDDGNRDDDDDDDDDGDDDDVSLSIDIAR